MDEIRNEVIETTEEMGTEDGMEKKFNLEEILGAGAIAVGAITVFEGGKFLVKKGKEPAKKMWGKFTGLFKKKNDPEVVVMTEPDHEELTTEVKEKTEKKKSDKKEK